MPFIRRALAVAGVVGLVAGPSAASAQPILTAASSWGTCSALAGAWQEFGSCGGFGTNYWSTEPAQRLAMYLTTNPNITPLTPFNPTGPLAPIALTLGVNTIYFAQNGVAGWTPLGGFTELGFNLMFDGNTNASISGWNALGVGGVQALAPNSATWNPYGGSASSAGLTYSHAGYTVTLSDLRFLNGNDQVGPDFDSPDGREDWSGSFRLDVRTATVPEPASIVLLGAGLAGLIAVRRRTRA